MFKFKNIVEFTKVFGTELKCEKYLIKMRFEDGKVECPYCKSATNWQTTEKRYKCGEYKTSFTLKIGTIFEGSKISLVKWFMAIYFLSYSAKGISGNQLAKELSTTQKSTWFMLKRLRHLMQSNASKDIFKGRTEVDETYIGGLEENKHLDKKGKKQKDIAIGLVNRDTKQVLAEKVLEDVEVGSNLVTDEFSSYKMLKLYYRHKKVNHSKKEYIREEGALKVHTNNTEGF